MGFDVDKFIANTSFKADIFLGKVVFVTGGAGTICRRQVEALVALGCDLAIIGRNPHKTQVTLEQISTLRYKLRCIGIGNIDVRNIKDLQTAVNITVEKLGRIDFVIAGALGNFISDFNHLSSNAFKSVVSIDLLGSFNTVKACFEQLKFHRGSVIFVSATLHYYGVPFQSHVGAAKAGIDALSNALAVELGPLGIRCNCIAPGAIAGTEGLKRLLKDESKAVKLTPLQRLGSIDDIAKATVWLFSPDSAYVTGTIQVVDGGLWHMGNFQYHEMYPEFLLKQLNDVPKL